MQPCSDTYWGTFSESSGFGSSQPDNDTSNRAWPYLVSKKCLDELLTGSHHTDPDFFTCRLHLAEMDRITEQTQPG